MPETTDTPPPPGTPEENTPKDVLSIALVELASRCPVTGPIECPPRLPFDQIELCPEAFQVRGEALSEHHLSELNRALNRVDDLDPVLVMPLDDAYVLLDGHHRLEAYRRSKDRADIPVTIFQGSVDKAVLTAAKANTLSVLPMDNRQRQNLAWRLVLTSKFSKQQIKAYAGISDGQVATMRRIKKALGDDAYEHESWWAARRAAEGKPIVTLSEDELEEWMDEKAQRWADRLAKHFSTKMAQNPVIAARALERHFGRKLPELCRELDKLAPLDDLADDECEPEDF